MWTLDKKIDLIRDIKDRECLWNPKNVLYSKKNVTDKNWTEVAKKLNKNGKVKLICLTILLCHKMSYKLLKYISIYRKGDEGGMEKSKGLLYEAKTGKQDSFW